MFAKKRYCPDIMKLDASGTSPDEQDRRHPDGEAFSFEISFTGKGCILASLLLYLAHWSSVDEVQTFDSKVFSIAITG
jgi:hypothetical protein